MSTLHIAILDKFIPPFINLINDNFQGQNQKFFIYGDSIKFPINTSDNVYLCKPARYKLLSLLKVLFGVVRAMHSSDKIVLHGLFDTKLICVLSLCPWLLKRCHWIIWGGDLYRSKAIRNGYKELLRRVVIKRIRYLITGTPGDVNLARKWYQATGKHITCFNYTSNVFSGNQLFKIANKKKNYLLIQVGNSGDPTNRHVDVFNKILNELQPGSYRLYIPLAYGDSKYIEHIKSEAIRIFGDAAKVQTELLPIDIYNEMQRNIDIAIFAHERQQAFGNIINLLGLGKTVYISDISTLNEVLISRNIKVFSFENDKLQTQCTDVALMNSEKIVDCFSKEKLIKSLSAWIL
ncbi:TDP-N-acetylfucosamine:lipid II N-acetylfucosaminyltransferase [Vibrio genomosp. F6]|uniref:4-alpha-L-fucosyltransferase n=1 Tax=Vibrio genomosp. F6 str. FF-238 TaxID=1191298 RepID=A0A1E5D3J9_9VIBR|nr:TDP-N-acetylfucosamine:lipid II N-acetylfucosaminyltransferase [Vibrio genomosp. F6]OEE77719.1 hypothetical protein A130_14410 [Vibrio genomosp. F6 str. FF-238]